MESKTIVFIHGLFVNPKIWEDWKIYFEAKGFTCHIPSYPYHEGNPWELRENSNPQLNKVTFKDVVNNILEFIDTLPEKPILIGHSLGGLIVQKLIEDDKAVAGICISSAAPHGLFTFKWSFWKSILPVINYFKGNSLFEPNKKWFHYAICNTLSREESDKIFFKYFIPESRNIPRGTLSKFATIDFNKKHNPLLFIAGEKDHIIPKSLNKTNFKAYQNNSGIKTFKEFINRDHYICGEQNWQEVAEYIMNWLVEVEKKSNQD